MQHPVERRRHAVRSSPFRAWPAVAALLVLTAGWELAVRLRGVDPSVLPAPSGILRASWSERASLSRDSWVTLRETLLGLALAAVVAAAVAAVMDRWHLLRRALEPILVGSQVLPIVAIAPLAIIWFGLGLGGKVLVVALYTFFPIVVGLVRGLRAADPDAEALVRSMGGRRRDVLWRVRAPSALPSAFTGIRLAATYGVVAAVTSEFLGAYDGLGITMQQARATYDTDLVFAAVLATFALTLALVGAVVAVERVVAPWTFHEGDA